MAATQYPKRLYHYTSANTLLSILQNKTLRLCSTSAMNDLTDGTLYIETIIDWARENGRPNVARHFTERRNQGFFAICFSTEKDDASQWARYVDSGRGFGVVFDGRALEFWCEQLMLRYDKVFYIPEFEVERILLNEPNLIARLDMLEAGGAISGYDDSEDFLDHQCVRAVMYKHPSFKSENEYRIAGRKLDIFLHAHRDWEDEDPDIRYKAHDYFVKGGIVAEYYDMPLEAETFGISDIIKGVVIGPNNPLTEQDVLGMALKYDLKLQAAQVQKSTCPLRG